MSQQPTPAEIVRKTVMYRMPGMESVEVRRGIQYCGADGARVLDLYVPPDAKAGARRPAVVVVAGYPDAGFEAMLGCKFKDMGSSVSWARLIAMSGMVAIAYANRDPVSDLRALLEYVRANAGELGIDATRLGLWSSSGNVPLALGTLVAEPREGIKCAALCYGLTLDLDGMTGVTEGAKTWGYANPAAGKSIEDLPRDVPLFVARAGQDQTPNLNQTLDHFIARALKGNLPLTVANHPDGPHAFDLFHDSERTREIVQQILGFLRVHLVG